MGLGYLIVVLLCISLIISDLKIFSHAYWPSVPYLRYVQLPCPFVNLVCFVVVELYGFLMYFGFLTFIE